MSTNYYVQTEKCDACGGQPEKIHLGKSSMGWQFTFQYNAGKFYTNVPEMKKWTKGKIIVDEYGDLIKHKDFWDMVKEKQIPANRNHAEYCKQYHPPALSDFVVGGYSFSDHDFC